MTKQMRKSFKFTYIQRAIFYNLKRFGKFQSGELDNTLYHVHVVDVVPKSRNYKPYFPLGNFRANT